MATTPGGLPYPVGTDKVTDGDNAIQALAEAVEAKYDAIEVRRWRVSRVGVPTGQTVYDLTQGVEQTGDRTVTYPTITYNATELSWTIATPGWYDIFLSVYIDWNYAGTGGRIQVTEDDKGNLPSAVGNFSSAAGQVASLHMGAMPSNGTKKLWFQGFHNAAAAANLDGYVRFIKLRD